jgi:uncharacterized protein
MKTGNAMSTRFTWNSRKAAQNRKKHDVSFDEALSVFRDSTAFIFDDEEHSEYEHRELIIGHSYLNRLLIIAFAEREELIRIISARRATQKEREKYEKAKR